MAATVEIIIKTIDEGSSKSTRTLKQNLDLVKKGVLGTAAAITALGVTAKKTFDLGKEGAQVLQLAESTRVLGVDMDALRRASNNTITDFGLMNATQTLLIGTQGTLKQAFLDNAAQLLKIAKAANTVNPALGDTSFLYQSIATGIKRSSPLILDNLGLVVKVGEANEAYAASIGKTVDQLTAEDKQMALLNATLDAGNVLINQASEMADQGVDSYAKFETVIGNLANRLKADAAPAIADTLEPLTKLIETGEKNNAIIKELDQLLADGAITQEEYNSAFRNGVAINYAVANSLMGVERAGERVVSVSEEAQWALRDKFDVMEEGMDITEDLTGAATDLALSEKAIGDSARWAAMGLQELYAAADPSQLGQFGKTLDLMDYVDLGGAKIQQFGDDLAAAWQLGAMSAEEYRKENEKGYVAQQALAVAVGDTSAWQAARDVAKQLEIGPQEARAMVEDLNGALQALDESEFTVYIDVITRGGDIRRLTGGAPGLGKMDALEGRASGGQLGKGWSVVGEQGFEIVSPTGYVFSNEESKALLMGGLQPGNKFLAGGEGPDDWVLPDYVTASTTTTTPKPKGGPKPPQKKTPSVDYAEEVTTSFVGNQGAADFSMITDQLTQKLEANNTELLGKLDELIAKTASPTDIEGAMASGYRRSGQ